MVYDPAWDMPQLNWKQQGSFEGGSVPPIVEPDAGTQVLIGPIAREWMPWICGALDQLRNPSAWVVADDAHMYDTLRRVDTLLGLICASTGVCTVTEVRLQDCVLQTSTDGGTTWTDAPGWSAGFAACVRDAIPPPPPNPGPDPIQQRACNIAGYLSTVIVSDAIAKAVSDYGTIKVYVDYAKWAVGNALAEEMPYFNLFVQAVFQVYQDLTALNIAEFTAAATDPVLIGLLTCAIYEAIHVDGAVTDANFPAALANVCAVTYGSPDVIVAICAMMTTIGGVNFRALQVTGAYEVFDCTGCGPWCNQVDWRISTGGYALRGAGVYTAGVGWQTTTLGGTGAANVVIQAGASGAGTHDRTSFNLFVQGSANTLFPGGREIDLLNLGVVTRSIILPDIAYPAMTKLAFSFTSTAVDEIIIGWVADGPGAVGTLIAEQDAGPGPSPGLLPPCTL
jgi:hypothetical protein